MTLQELGLRNGAGRLKTGEQAREGRDFTLNTENKRLYGGERTLCEKWGVKQEVPRIRIPCGNSLSTVICPPRGVFWQGSSYIGFVAL